MSIILECKCGKQFRGKDEYASKHIKCPACGKLLVIKRKETPNGPFEPPKRQKADSPINDTELNELRVTETFRRCIRHAAIWFRIQFLIHLVGAIVILIFIVLTFFSEDSASLEVQIVEATLIGWVFLLYMVYKATWDCRRWAPMLMLVLNTLSAAGLILAAIATDLGPHGDRMTRIGMCTPAIIPVILAIICYRAWDAIPRFLSQPAWCQNTLLQIGL